ncbi:MAG: hypothetical protein WBD48_15275 [Pseudolabrys sp.]
MKIEFTSRYVALAAGVAIGVAFALSGAAHAITDTVFRYSTTQKGFLGFPPSAFAPGNGGNTFYNIYNDGTLLQVASAQTCVNAPVNLPQGATMTDFAIWYSKQTGTAVLTLVTATYSANADTVLLTLSLADTASARVGISRAITGAGARIDNAHNSYWLRFCADNGTYFNGMRIAYTYTTAGD